MPAEPLPAPRDLSRRPAELLAELDGLIGTKAAVLVCADLLEGADPHEHAGALPYLAGAAAHGVLSGEWAPSWARVWGARGLRYVWVVSVAPAVIAGLRDEQWRVTEMCLKVSALRELGEAGPGAVPLTRHDLPRVREAAVRTLGVVGDTEHVQTVEATLDDEHDAVRRAAVRALRLMATRLDRDLDDPERL